MGECALVLKGGASYSAILAVAVKDLPCFVVTMRVYLCFYPVPYYTVFYYSVAILYRRLCALPYNLAYGLQLDYIDLLSKLSFLIGFYW